MKFKYLVETLEEPQCVRYTVKHDKDSFHTVTEDNGAAGGNSAAQ